MALLKKKAREWVDVLHDNELAPEKIDATINHSFYFKLEGFADEPEIYLRPIKEGLEFGFETVQWDGQLISSEPLRVKKHLLAEEVLQSLSKEQLKLIILEFIMKTVNSRKRQYRKCQFCGEKTAVEHRFDEETCHSCASDHFGIVY